MMLAREEEESVAKEEAAIDIVIQVPASTVEQLEELSME